MKGFFSKIWKWKVILVMAFSFLCVISSFLPPSWFWGLYFLSYALPVALVFNLLLMGFYLFFKKHFWLISISTTLCFIGFRNNVSFGGKEQDVTAAYSLMSYNVRLFDFYNWLDGKAWDKWKERTDNGAVLDSIYETLELSNADFLCLQEFFNQKSGEYRTEKTLRDMGYRYRHIAYSRSAKLNQYGIATFSKYPIIHKEDTFFTRKNFNNGVLITDVKANRDTFRIINVHLESFKLGRKDYLYLNQLSDSALVSMQKQPTKDLIHKIKLASEARATRKQLNNGARVAWMLEK